MQESFKILFHENGDPIDHRCIRRFICAFPKGYHDVVKDIIEKSSRVDKEIFKFTVATLMPSFKMTRAGPFRGVKIEAGKIKDPNGIIDKCWDKMGPDLLKLKKHLKDKGPRNRARTIVDVSSEVRNEIFKMTNNLFEALQPICQGKLSQGRVGTSKILFSVLPEIALPVDNAEWNAVFKTKRYTKILETMAEEIIEWERKTKIHLETSDPHPNTTLPSIYNIMAMAARQL